VLVVDHPVRIPPGLSEALCESVERLSTGRSEFGPSSSFSLFCHHFLVNPCPHPLVRVAVFPFDALRSWNSPSQRRPLFFVDGCLTALPSDVTPLRREFSPY